MRRPAAQRRLTAVGDALRVKIVRGRGRQPWRVKTYGLNGEQLTVSEGYVTKWNAKRAAKRMFPEIEPVYLNETAR